MSDQVNKASGVLFVLLLLLAVAMWVLFTIDRGLTDAVAVRDVAVEGGLVERRLLSEEVVQGAQFLAAAPNKDKRTAKNDLTRLPIAYWHPDGPLGQAFARFNWFSTKRNTWAADVRLPASLVGQGAPAFLLPLPLLVAAWSEPPIGVVQLKAGAPAAYARPFQIIDFYEMNPAITRLSKPGEEGLDFTYLRDAERRGARVRIVDGPELESLPRHGPKDFYKLLIVETARRGDQVAAELITKEAIHQYLQALAGDGVLCLHVSSSDPQLRLRLGESTADLGLTTKLGEDRADGRNGHYPSDWLMIARRPEHLAHLQPRDPESTVRWLTPVPRDGRNRGAKPQP